MIELIKPEFPNFGRYCLERGGIVKELYIPVTDSVWPGLCNPSIFNDNGQLRVIIRNINFIMHASVDDERNWSDWGPLLYANRDADNRQLKTRNFLATLTDDLDISSYCPIDTTRFDKKPIWEFEGLEDARLVRWNGELYGIGVRRDDNTTGQGRMEMSHINENGEELGRAKINHKSFDYCEKNWVPVVDEPFTFVRFAYPTMIVKTNEKGIVQDIKEYPVPEGIYPHHDMQLRGSSQILTWRNYRIGLFHTCTMYINELGRKYARYHYHFILWDKNWNLIKISRLFCFNDLLIEFSNGMTIKDGKFIFSFAMQDNMAFVMSVPEQAVEDFIFERESESSRPLNDNLVTHFFFNDKNPKMLYDYGVELYNKDMKAAAHALFERSVDYNDDPYNAWFMKTRCIADFGSRESFELDGWRRLIMMDPNRPEGYLALSSYYQYRNDSNLSFYYASMAYRFKDNAKFYYTNESYINQYLYTMLFTERRIEAENYIQQLPDNYTWIKNTCAEVLKDRKIERVL